jgi:indole-3-glycerol phosphate synthase
MLLDEIMVYKRQEVDRKKRAVPLNELESWAANRALPLDFAGVLRGEGLRLIAEIKRASPSKGIFCPDLDPVQLAQTYVVNGAAAISVLTDQKFFLGELEFLNRIQSEFVNSSLRGTARQHLMPTVPLLRKDFIFDPYQVHETYAFRADALLLIAAVLSDEELDELFSLTRELGMTPLVEVHNEHELERVLRLSPQVVGINNRNLKDFSIDLGTFGRLRSLITGDVITVAESGVRTAADERRLANMGADAVLVGEALVTAPDVAAKVRELAGAAIMSPDTKTDVERER